MENEELKGYFEIAKPFIEPIITTILKPQLNKISAFLKKKSVDNKVVDNYFESKFTQYLSRTYQNSSYINTLVFPNQQVKLKDIYYPLTIVSTKDHQTHNITNKFHETLLNTVKRILISDTAGMGKSTLMKWFTLNLIENPSSMPILIELRKLNKNHNVLDEIYQLIDPIDKSFEKELIIKLLELGFFTIIFDGYDEIPKDIQEEITIELRDFIKKVPENNFVITSRPESALASFGDFQQFYIKPLEPNESFDLIRKYDNLNKIKYSESLIQEVQNRIGQVSAFLSNPFLVSLLYKSYTFNKDIPSKKATFYDEVYTSLFKHHDLSKDGFKRPKISKLDILDFRIILRNLAFETSKLGQVIYTEPEFLRFLSNAKNRITSINFKEVEYLDDLLTTVPLFVRDGSQIKWAHKSIQDYFAAEHIAYHSKKEEILSRIFTSEKENYLNIIDLIHEIEPKLFRKVVLYPLLKTYIKHYEESYLDSIGIPAYLLEERKSETFGITSCIIKGNEDIGFPNARTLFKNALGLNVENFFSSGTQLVSENIYILSIKHFNFQIIKILRNKMEDLFKKLTHKVTREYPYINKLPYNIAFIINDDKTSLLNKPDIFSEVNSLLINQLEQSNQKIILDYSKVKAIYEQLEKEIIKDISDDELNNI